MEEAVEGIWHRLLPTEAERAIRTLAKVLDNAVRHPREVKYRVLCKSNARVAQRLPCGECFNVLRLCGFVDTPEALVLPEGSDLSRLSNVCSQLGHVLAVGSPFSAGNINPSAGAAGNRRVAVQFGQMRLHVELSACQGSLDGLRAQLFTHTSVPPERQRLSMAGVVLTESISWAAVTSIPARIHMVDVQACNEECLPSPVVQADDSSVGRAEAALIPYGAAEETRHALTPARSFFIGTGASCDIQVVGSVAEPQHCAVYIVASADGRRCIAAEIEDHSRLGTYLNGVRLQPRLVRHPFRHGDVLSLGSPIPAVGMSFLLEMRSIKQKQSEENSVEPGFLQFSLSVNSPSAATIMVRLEEQGAVCQAGHLLEMFVTTQDDWECDICGAHVAAGRQLHGCRQCDYDECHDCRQKSKAQKSIDCELVREGLGSPNFKSLVLPVCAKAETTVNYRFEVLEADGTPGSQLGPTRSRRVPCAGHVQVILEDWMQCPTGLHPEIDATGTAAQPEPVPIDAFCSTELNSWLRPSPGRLSGKQRCFQFWHDGLLIPYFLYLPPGDPPTDSGWPLLVYLHGDHGRRPEDCSQPGVSRYALNSGPPKLFARAGQSSLAERSFVGLAPQCPEEFYWFKEGDWFSNRWAAKMMACLTSLLEHVELHIRIDCRRRYITGHSMGGYGALEFALAHPDTFAAAVPVSGHFEERRQEDLARAIAHVPIRMYHCLDDNVCLPRNAGLIEQAFHEIGAHRLEVRWLELDAGYEHGADIPAYEASDEELFKWLLEQHRADPESSSHKPSPESGGGGGADHVERREAVLDVANPVSVVSDKYYICGSWTGWAFDELLLHQDGTVRCLATVNDNCQATFQIVRNQDWSQRYYPRLVSADTLTPKGGAETCLCGAAFEEAQALPGVADGPGPQGHDVNWLIKSIGANARFAIIFDPRVPSVRWSPHYDEGERASIRRLTELGLSAAAAVRAFSIAGRNEALATEMASTFLFEPSEGLIFGLSP